MFDRAACAGMDVWEMMGWWVVATVCVEWLNLRSIAQTGFPGNAWPGLFGRHGRQRRRRRARQIPCPAKLLGSCFEVNNLLPTSPSTRRKTGSMAPYGRDTPMEQPTPGMQRPCSRRTRRPMKRSPLLSATARASPALAIRTARRPPASVTLSAPQSLPWRPARLPST